MPKLKEYKMYINGEWIDAENKKTFQTLNPENNEPWAIVPEAGAKDVDKAVHAAQEAFEGEWPKLLPRERANYLKAIANQLREMQKCWEKLKQLIQENFLEKQKLKQIILQSIMIILLV